MVSHSLFDVLNLMCFDRNYFIIYLLSFLYIFSAIFCCMFFVFVALFTMTSDCVFIYLILVQEKKKKKFHIFKYEVNKNGSKSKPI